MLILRQATESAITTLRIAEFLRTELSARLPELFEGEDAIKESDLQQAVDEARDKLRPWGMETERIVAKYCFGSFLLGAPLEDVEPRLLRIFHGPYHRYRKEEVVDIVIERELGQRKTTGAAS